MDVVPVFGSKDMGQGIGMVMHYHLWLTTGAGCEIHQEIVGYLILAFLAPELGRKHASLPEVLPILRNCRPYADAMLQ